MAQPEQTEPRGDVHTDAAPDLMKPQQLAAELLVSEATLSRMRRPGATGPPFLRLGRAVRYSRRAVTEWLEAQEQERQKASDVA
ncbi:MAG: helix-turn-helix transcriptional regulator [Nocardioidaceae bacterium]